MSTNGPWTIVPQSNGDALIAHMKDATGRNMRLIGFVMSRPASVDEDVANARLIAAAPDLLALAKEYHAFCIDQDRDYLAQEAAKVIAKAEGKS